MTNLDKFWIIQNRHLFSHFYVADNTKCFKSGFYTFENKSLTTSRIFSLVFSYNFSKIVGMIFYFKKIKGALELGIQKYILYNYPQ
jgi:hypothetical protein